MVVQTTSVGSARRLRRDASLAMRALAALSAAVLSACFARNHRGFLFFCYGNNWTIIGEVHFCPRLALSLTLRAERWLLWGTFRYQVRQFDNRKAPILRRV